MQAQCYPEPLDKDLQVPNITILAEASNVKTTQKKKKTKKKKKNKKEEEEEEVKKQKKEKNISLQSRRERENARK
jgi:hypothetical protein